MPVPNATAGRRGSARRTRRGSLGGMCSGSREPWKAERARTQASRRQDAGGERALGATPAPPSAGLEGSWRRLTVLARLEADEKNPRKKRMGPASGGGLRCRMQEAAAGPENWFPVSAVRRTVRLLRSRWGISPRPTDHEPHRERIVFSFFVGSGRPLLRRLAVVRAVLHPFATSVPSPNPRTKRAR